MIGKSFLEYSGFFLYINNWQHVIYETISPKLQLFNRSLTIWSIVEYWSIIVENYLKTGIISSIIEIPLKDFDFAMNQWLCMVVFWQINLL